MTEYIFDDYQEIERIKEYNNIFLFLDYDGTLAPFKDDPARAVPFPGICSLLKKMIEREKFIVNLISGRSLKDLRSMLSLEGINYVGNHGLEIELNGMDRLDWKKEIEFDSSLLNEIKQLLKNRYTGRDGYRVEDKGPVVTLHIPEGENAKHNIIKLLNEKSKKKMEVFSGRQIVEVRPYGWNKGKAVEYTCNSIKKNQNIENFIIIYVGDDTTDEDAFRILKENDTGVYVKNNGDLETNADYYVESPKDVKRLLEKLI